VEGLTFDRYFNNMFDNDVSERRLREEEESQAGVFETRNRCGNRLYLSPIPNPMCELSP
jgi:hypothetical protein